MRILSESASIVLFSDIDLSVRVTQDNAKFLKKGSGSYDKFGKLDPRALNKSIYLD